MVQFLDELRFTQVCTWKGQSAYNFKYVRFLYIPAFYFIRQQEQRAFALVARGENLKEEMMV